MTYTAVDVSDGELPVPGSAQVDFTNGGGGCVSTIVPPVGENGNVVTPWATGFVAENFFFGNVNWGGCPGASEPAFAGGAAFVADFRTGDLFKLGAEGGAVSSGDALANLGPTLGQPRFGKDGRLYVTRAATTGNFTTGALFEIDPATGAIIRTVASNLTCPGGVAVDPLSGDLFLTDACTGAGSDDPSIFRIVDPAGPSPSVVVYATLPATPNGGLAFAPNGTLYAVSGYFGNPAAPVLRVGGTDTPQPPAIDPLPGVTSAFGVSVAEVLPNGEARSLLVHSFDDLRLVDLTVNPVATTVLASGSVGTGPIGPDGCLYLEGGDRLHRLTDETGACGFSPTSPVPSLRLTPPAVMPNPARGTSRTLSATFHNVGVPAGTPVFFEVSGANPQVHMTPADASGTATFSYTAAQTGEDVIVAKATVDDATLTSNRARITWDEGKHVTFLTLNPSPRAGTPGQAVVVRAALTDVSVDPAVPVPGVSIDFALAGAECSGMTDVDGLAACELVVGAAGTTALTASFAGTSQLLASTSAIGFAAVGITTLGHFTTYKTKPPTGAAKLFKLGPVVLTDDAFGTAGGYDVLKQTELAAPASKNGEGFTDPDTHLLAYAVKLAKGSPRFQKETDVRVTNQCGETVITATKPASLLVPTAKDLDAPVAPPLEADHNLDHFLCYKVKAQRKLTDGTPVVRLPKGAQVEVTDQLQSRRYDLKKPVLLCNPVAKSGSPVLLAGPQKGTPFPLTPAAVRNPASHLLCYQAKPASKQIDQTGCGPTDPKDRGTKIVPKQPKHVRRLGVHVANQLEVTRLDTRKESLVCIPSTVE